MATSSKGQELVPASAEQRRALIKDVMRGADVPAQESGVAWDELEGFSPEVPVSCSLGDHVNSVVQVVRVQHVENVLKEEQQKRGVPAPDTVPEFIFLSTDDGRYYRAVAGNKKALRDAELMMDALKVFPSVTARVIGLPVRGQANDAIAFGPVETRDR